MGSILTFAAIGGLIFLCAALILGAGWWAVRTGWDMLWDVGGEWSERFRRWRK